MAQTRVVTLWPRHPTKPKPFSHVSIGESQLPGFVYCGREVAFASKSTRTPVYYSLCLPDHPRTHPKSSSLETHLSKTFIMLFLKIAIAAVLAVSVSSTPTQNDRVPTNSILQSRGLGDGLLDKRSSQGSRCATCDSSECTSITSGCKASVQWSSDFCTRSFG
ncbi:hypothetical protein DFH28DRAFT_1220620, partial [Melampsora americana]